MPAIDITKIVHTCDACERHFTGSNGVVITLATKKIILCNECVKELTEKLVKFLKIESEENL